MKHTLLRHCREAARHSAATPPPFLCVEAAPFIRRAAAHFIALAALALVSAPAGAETMQIASAADWATFANRVNAGETSLCATMISDVTLGNDAPRVGDTESHIWTGSFDGGGHTLMVDWTLSGTAYAAPFAIVSGCSIHDLHIAGSISTDTKYAGGFIGWARPGDSTLERCRSSVAITCTVSGEASCGGFVGRTYWSTYSINFRDCLFDGSLLGQNAEKCGGFAVNASADPNIRLYNCLSAPTAITVSAMNSATFAPSYYPGHTYVTACYYTRTLGTAQGTDASAMSADALAAALGSNWTNVNGMVMLTLFTTPPVPPIPAVAGFAYQGALRDAQGQTLAERSHTIAFRIYGQGAGGEPLWGRSHAVTLDANGLFNAILADDVGDAIDGVASNGLASVLAANADTTLYVGLTVDDDEAEISPRQKLLAVPYAVWAYDAASASGDLVAAGAAKSGNLSVSSGLTAASATATGAVSSGTLAIAGRATVNGDLVVSGAVSGAGTIPIGGIVAWSGSVADIPAGWALCDGQMAENRRTPDLRNRFVVGAGGEYAVGATGGEKAHTLTLGEMPSHRHAYKFKGADLDLSWKDHNYFYNMSDHYSGNGNTKYTDYAGGGEAHENRPPYYALCYIMRVR